MTRTRLSPFRCFVMISAVILVASRADAVVPVLIGPLQAFLAILPGLLLALGTMLLAIFSPRGMKKICLFFWHQKIFSVCVILLIAGGVYASSNNWWMTGDVTAAMEGKDWTAFRGGPERRGFVLNLTNPALSDPTEPDAVWDYVGEETFYSTPTVVGNRVYATFADQGPFKDNGGILCLDTETGGEVWRFTKLKGGFRATFSSPAVQGDYIVSGEGLHFTRDARIVCINKNGKLLWSHQTKSHVESSPCIANGKVYIGAGDDGYYCLSLEPKDGKANVIWHLEGDEYRDCEASPIVHDGVMYAGLGVGGRAILAVDAETGVVKWRMNTSYPVFGPPTIANGKLYVGMGHGDFVNPAEVVQINTRLKLKKEGKSEQEIEEAVKDIGPVGEIWCIDLEKVAANPEKYEPEWKFKVGRTVLGAVAAAGERLYFGSRDQNLYCISTEGKELARWNAHAEMTISPAVAKEHVYVVTASGMLHCLSADGLEPVWEAPLGAGTMFFSSPTVAMGRVYVGTAENGLRCIGRAGPKPPVVWGRGSAGGRAGRAPVASRSKLYWLYPTSLGSDDKFAVTAPMASLDDLMLVPCKLNGQQQLVALKTSYGAKVSQRRIKDKQRVVWQMDFERPITVAPAGMGQTLYVVDGKPGDAKRTMHCIDVKLGKTLWTADLGADSPGLVTVDSERLYLWTTEKTLACYPLGHETKPEPLWSADLGPADVEPGAGEGLLLVATRDGRLLTLDAASGRPLRTKPLKLSAKPTVPPLLVDDHVLVGTETGVTAVSIVTGKIRWEAKTGPVAQPLSSNGKSVSLINAKGHFLALDYVTGEEQARDENAVPVAAPIMASGRIVFTQKEDLNVLESVDVDKTAQWAHTSWLGKIMQPLVMLDSRMYIVTEKRHVVCLEPSSQ
jgi:eukaryotic-like serine/threonine-protein kinase